MSFDIFFKESEANYKINIGARRTSQLQRSIFLSASFLSLSLSSITDGYIDNGNNKLKLKAYFRFMRCWFFGNAEHNAVHLCALPSRPPPR